MNKVYTPGANILAEEDFTKLQVTLQNLFFICARIFLLQDLHVTLVNTFTCAGCFSNLITYAEYLIRIFHPLTPPAHHIFKIEQCLSTDSRL